MNSEINPFQDIAKMASNQENTLELQNFWLQKYLNMLSSGKFVLSVKTEELLIANLPIERPATPYGDLILVRFLKSNNSLDEANFQETVETSVRFLDALIDAINFVPNARFVVSQYRKIGLGILDFAEYLSRRRTSEIQEIDYIGDLISNNCYRASEALAQEKGACANWEQINKHIRPKLFEHWINKKTKAIRTSLEVAEDVGSGSAIEQDWEIVPRRNSSLLLLPKNLEWQIWSDRDETSPKTEFKQLENEAPKPNLKGDLNNQDKVFDINTKVEVESIPQLNETSLDGIKPSVVDNFSTPSLEQIANQNTMQAKERIANSQETENNNWLEKASQDPSNPFETIYQIGELIKIRRPDVQEYGKVYQIIEAVASKSGKGFSYRITDGNLESERKLWLEKDFVPVDLLDVLEKMNEFEKVKNQLLDLQKKSLNPAVNLDLVILDPDKTHFMVYEVDGKVFLPSVVWNGSFSFEDCVQEYLDKSFGVKMESVETFADVAYKNPETGMFSLFVGLLTKVTFKEPSTKLFWHSFDEVDALPDHSITMIQKYLLGEDDQTLENEANFEIVKSQNPEYTGDVDISKDEVFEDQTQIENKNTELTLEKEVEMGMEMLASNEVKQAEVVDQSQNNAEVQTELENVDQAMQEVAKMASEFGAGVYEGDDYDQKDSDYKDYNEQIEQKVVENDQILPESQKNMDNNQTDFNFESENTIEPIETLEIQEPSQDQDQNQNQEPILEQIQNQDQDQNQEVVEKVAVRTQIPVVEIVGGNPSVIANKAEIKPETQIQTPTPVQVQTQPTSVVKISKPKVSTTSSLLSILKKHQ
jgi:hypothetical protein